MHINKNILNLFTYEFPRLVSACYIVGEIISLAWLVESTRSSTGKIFGFKSLIVDKNYWCQNFLHLTIVCSQGIMSVMTDLGPKQGEDLYVNI